MIDTRNEDIVDGIYIKINFDYEIENCIFSMAVTNFLYAEPPKKT